jgi:tetratricopeptide (TPR) repeat protein
MIVGIIGSYSVRGEDSSDEGQISCISFYQNGDYEKAIDCLTLVLSHTLKGSDSILIYKYLGFSNGMLGRIDLAKEDFNILLDMAPDMQIDTLEYPPNISIIFNQVKLERKIAKIDTVTLALRSQVTEKKNPFVPILLLTGGTAFAAAGGYWYYSGYTIHNEYLALNTPDQKQMDKYYNNYRNQYIKSAVSFGISAVLLPVSTYLFLRKGSLSKHVAFCTIHGMPSLVYSF